MARNRKRAQKERSAPRAGAARNGHDDRDDVAAPLEHATPDAELAEAQLAVGRPEPSDVVPFEDETGEDEMPPAGTGGGSRALSTTPRGESGRETHPDAPRESLPVRLVSFLQGSWRELQRVQWPDRRQVMQATGVVLGFVIVAAAFLGVADWVAGKVVTFILQ